MKHRYVVLMWIFLSASSHGSNWNIKCRYADDRLNVFWTSEAIEGAVDFVNTDHANLILERINAELIGEYVQKVTQRVNYTDVEDESRIRFLAERIIVHPIGTMGKFPVPYGSHSWPFRFRLNDSLPPTFNMHTHTSPFIHYFIRITFVRSQWYKSNPEQICPIVVKPLSHMKPTRIGNETTSRKKGVRMRVILHNNVVVAGSNISFDLHLHNPKQVLVRRVSMIFSRSLQMPTNASVKVDNLIGKDLEKTKRFSGRELNENFQINVSSTALPTFSFRLLSNSTKYPLAVSYKLRFETHLRGFFTNVVLEFPVTVTELMPEMDDED